MRIPSSSRGKHSLPHEIWAPKPAHTNRNPACRVGSLWKAAQSSNSKEHVSKMSDRTPVTSPPHHSSRPTQLQPQAFAERPPVPRRFLWMGGVALIVLIVFLVTLLRLALPAFQQLAPNWTQVGQLLRQDTTRGNTVTLLLYTFSPVLWLLIVGLMYLLWIVLLRDFFTDYLRASSSSTATVPPPEPCSVERSRQAADGEPTRQHTYGAVRHRQS
jgi:hypothetical protein